MRAAITPTEATFLAADGRTDLPLHLFTPPVPPTSAVLLFHGGAWMSGRPAMLFPQARALAESGALVACAGYRLIGSGASSLRDCVADAALADLALREIAAHLGVTSVQVGGGSAGAQLALALAMGLGTSVASYDALLLLNPALDLVAGGPGTFGGLQELLGISPDEARKLSPLHHVRASLPPTLLVHGTADVLVPVEQARDFRDRMLAVGNDCLLVEFAGAAHGFFNEAGLDAARVLDLLTGFVRAARPARA